MAEQKKILAIDDEPAMGELIKLILRRKGYTVKFTPDHQMFFRFIANEDFDLFIVDLMMPNMDGWEIYQRLKSNEKTKEVPIIICSSKAQSIDRVLGLHIANVDDYVTKPFGPQELLDSIEKVLREA